jgi:hypothetical protein
MIDLAGRTLGCMELDLLSPAAPSLATVTSCRSENHPLCRGEGRATPAWGVALTQRRGGAGSARRGRSPLAPVHSNVGFALLDAAVSTSVVVGETILKVAGPATNVRATRKVRGQRATITMATPSAQPLAPAFDSGAGPRDQK